LPEVYSEEVDAIFFDEPYLLDEQVRRFIAHGRDLMNTSSIMKTGINPNLVPFSESAMESMFMVMNALVSQIEQDGEISVEVRQLILTGSLATILLSLIVVAIFF
jgi:hypothetical protein